MYNKGEQLIEAVEKDNYEQVLMILDTIETHIKFNKECNEQSILEDIINHQNKHGQTALHKAAENVNLAMIALLLKHNAKPYIADNKDITPIDIFYKQDQKEMVDKFVELGCKININTIRKPNAQKSKQVAELPPFLTRNEEGEVVAKSANTMLRFLNTETRNAKVIIQDMADKTWNLMLL